MIKKTKEELALEEYLAGLTEKKAKTSDNVIIHNKSRANNPIYKEKLKESLLATITDPVWKNKQSERMKDLYKNNEEYRNNLINGHIKRVNNPNWIEKHKINCEKRKNDPIYKEKMKEVAVKRLSNSSWVKGQKIKAINQYSPVSTPEGYFVKFRLAVIHYMKIWNLKKGGADYRLRKYLNDIDNNEFIRISIEEYIMLTGKDPYNE